MKQLWSTISIYSWIMICSIFCYAEDSIPATDLQEIVVKSERAWIEGGVYNFIPSKQEKKLSNSPGSLIDVMNLPFLKGDGENVITTTGEPVTIFINGQLASQTDLATFWPKLAKKVERKRMYCRAYPIMGNIGLAPSWFIRRCHTALCLNMTITTTDLRPPPSLRLTVIFSMEERNMMR